MSRSLDRVVGLALALFGALVLASCSQLPAPRVSAFDARPATLARGTSATLQWTLAGGPPSSVTIDQGVGDVTALSDVTVHPAATTTYTLTARNGGGSDTRQVTVTVEADPFAITLDFASSISSTQRAAFESAAARWARVVTQGLPDTAATIPAGVCSGLPTSTFNGTIDDVLISVQVGPIDGPGKVLGFGGPCYTRSSDGLTAYGIMQFDSADLAQLEQQGLLQTTMLHEMGHVLGFGTLWGSLLTGGGTNDPRFTGVNAVREWQALGGTGQVPVENCLDAGGAPIQGCGSGTRDAHWREATFGSELMTGYLNGGTNPMSRVSIGSLADLGYAVDYAAADSYGLPAGVTGQSLAAATHLDFKLVTPIGSLP